MHLCIHSLVLGCHDCDNNYDVSNSVASSDEHQFSLDGQSKQFITINVNSINANFKSFGKCVL